MKVTGDNITDKQLRWLLDSSDIRIATDAAGALDKRTPSTTRGLLRERCAAVYMRQDKPDRRADVSGATLRYRYECPCGAHGRWRVNPNDAHADGERHRDRFEYGHDTQLVDSAGNHHGATH